MSKRQKFIIAAAVLTFEVVVSRLGLGQLFQWRIRAGLFALSSVALTVWALWDQDFSGIEWLTLPILPVGFALSGLLVFPLLPTNFEAVLSFPLTVDAGFVLSVTVRVLFLSVFLIGYYASLLTSNIFNIAALRTIQLLRVAHSVGFLMTVATALFFYLVIFSFRLDGVLNFLLVVAVSAPLCFQSLWSLSLEERIGERTRNYSLVTSLILGQVAWAISFWPISNSIAALFLTAIFYEMLGIVQYHFGERLSTRIVNEFIIVAIIVFLITFMTAQWGG